MTHLACEHLSKLYIDYETNINCQDLRVLLKAETMAISDVSCSSEKIRQSSVKNVLKGKYSEIYIM